MFRRFWWVFPISLVLGPLLGLLVGGVIAYISPKQYDSTAVIQVRPVFQSPQGAPGQMPAVDPTFFATEFEVLRAQVTLDRVIEELDLTTRWGMSRAEALDRLRQTIETRNIRGTDLIEIRVRTTNPHDSKVIAEAVSEAYRNRRREEEGKRTARALEELQEAVREQEDVVEDKRKMLMRLAPEFTKDQLEQLKSKIADEATAPRGRSHAAFDNAKTDFESAVSILEQLKIKLISNEMGRRLVEDPVIVHAHPVEAIRPTSPNVPKLLLFGTGAGLVFGLIAPFGLIPLLHLATRPSS